MPLRLEAILKRYPSPDGPPLTVLNVPQFELADAHQVALVGTSGGGKSTLLHVIAGIIRPDAGRVLHDGTDTAALSEHARDVFRGRNLGYVFQTHHLLPGFTSLENVLLGMSFTGRRPDRAWAEHLLDAVGLADRLHHAPGKLSLGQQQRVAVARALANRPKRVLADEPTGSLDAANAVAVLRLMKSLCAEAGAALLLVTHDRAVATQFDTVVRLEDINRTQTAGVPTAGEPA
ncbi:MAG: ABC transporter ATP-binding protein [Phycisphaerae bacterium]